MTISFTRDTNYSFVKTTTNGTGEQFSIKIEKGNDNRPNVEYLFVCSLFHSNSVQIAIGNSVTVKDPCNQPNPPPMNQLPPAFTATIDSAIAELKKIRAGLTEPSESQRNEADALLIEKLELHSVRLSAENAILQTRLKTVCEDAIEAMCINDMTAFNILHPFTEKGMRERAQAEVKAQEVNSQ